MNLHEGQIGIRHKETHESRDLRDSNQRNEDFETVIGKNNNMEKYKRDAVFSELKGHCTFAKENDFIEITEWNNGEGFDIQVSSKYLGHRNVQYTWGEFDLIIKMLREMGWIEEQEEEYNDVLNKAFKALENVRKKFKKKQNQLGENSA